MQDNIADFPSQDQNAAAGLAELQGTKERTRVITVMQRRVANENGTMTEIGAPVNVFIRPLPFRRWFLVLGEMKNILNGVTGLNVDLNDPTKLGMWIAEIIANAPDSILTIASLATDKPVSFFDEIDLDEGLNIILAVVEVNKDFFVQKVLPLVYEKAPQLKQTVETFGQTA